MTRLPVALVNLHVTHLPGLHVLMMMTMTVVTMIITIIIIMETK